MGSIIATALGIALIAGLIVCCVKASKKKKQTRCKKCKTAYNFDSDVTYTVFKQRVPDRNGTNVRVQFNCKCGNCGEEATFIREFPDQRVQPDGKVASINYEEAIKEYFKK